VWRLLCSGVRPGAEPKSNALPTSSSRRLHNLPNILSYSWEQSGNFFLVSCAFDHIIFVFRGGNTLKTSIQKHVNNITVDALFYLWTFCRRTQRTTTTERITMRTTTATPTATPATTPTTQSHKQTYHKIQYDIPGGSKKWGQRIFRPYLLNVLANSDNFWHTSATVYSEYSTERYLLLLFTKIK